MYSSFSLILIITCEIYTTLSLSPGRCEPVPVEKSKTVGMFTFTVGLQGYCTNYGEVEGLMECRGYCQSSDVYDMRTDSYEPSCECCRVERFTVIPVLLTCVENNNTTMYDVRSPDQCSCIPCGASRTPSVPSSTAKIDHSSY